MTTAVHPDQDTAGDQMERSAEFEPRPMILGIATALAQRYGVSVAVVRAAFTTLAVAGGVGIALYLLIALGWKHRSSIVQPPSGSRDLGAILLTIGVVWQLGSIWQGVNPTLVLPVGLVALGVALGWRSGPPGAFDGFPSSDTSRSNTGGLAKIGRTRMLIARILGGVVLCFGGLAVLLGQSADYSALRDAGLALLVATAGAALVIGPSAVRFVQSFSLERDDRVRAEERARVAAHLHDSVLQTLTLIQKKADDPAATASLARHQERSLRRWLYGTGGAYATADGDSRTIGWRTAMEEMVGAVEDHYATAIELVMVGDGEIFNGGPANDPSSPNGRGRSADESARATAVIAAAREALINASKFSGETHLSIYCELGDDRFDVFVRDRGKGFDLATVDPDRRGVRDSIVTRLAAVGGHATIRTAPGEGTEVALSVPIRVQPTNGRSPAEAPPAGTTPAGTTTRAIEGVSDR